MIFSSWLQVHTELVHFEPTSMWEDFSLAPKGALFLINLIIATHAEYLNATTIMARSTHDPRRLCYSRFYFWDLSKPLLGSIFNIALSVMLQLVFHQHQ